MKKLSVLLVAVILMLSLFGCGNGEQLARETAEGFLNAFCELDIEKMKGFVDDTSKLPEEIKNFDKEKLVEEFPPELQGYSAELEGYVNSYFNKLKEYLSYNIKETVKTDDGYEFVVDLTTPDYQNVDFEEMLANELSTEKATAIINELLESGAITYESTEEEMFAAVIPKVASVMQDIIKDIELTTITEESVLVVVEKGGQWLVSAEKSQMGY